MNVSLTPELETLVHDKVESGLYNSASEVVREALRLLRERDEFQRQRLDALQHEIAVGLEQLDRGEATTYNDQSLKHRFEQIKAEGRKSLAAPKEKSGLMRQYRVSNQANTDLTDIWLYAAQDTQAAADRLLDRIYQAFQKIADMPGIGHRRDDLTGQRLRFWPVGQYVIIYRPETDPLEIARIVSGYRDIAALLLE